MGGESRVVLAVVVVVGMVWGARWLDGRRAPDVRALALRVPCVKRGEHGLLPGRADVERVAARVDADLPEQPELHAAGSLRSNRPDRRHRCCPLRKVTARSPPRPRRDRGHDGQIVG